MRSIVKLVFNIEATLVVEREQVNKYNKRFIITTPDRKLMDALFQDSVVDTAVEKLIEAMDEINEEHTTLSQTKPR